MKKWAQVHEELAQDPQFKTLLAGRNYFQFDKNQIDDYAVGMEAIFGLLILLVIVWALFIRGALFKLIIAIFAFIGMRSYLLSNYPSSHSIFLTIVDWQITYATSIPIALIILAMATTSIRND